MYQVNMIGALLSNVVSAFIFKTDHIQCIHYSDSILFNHYTLKFFVCFLLFIIFSTLQTNNSTQLYPAVQEDIFFVHLLLYKDKMMSNIFFVRKSLL